LTIFPPLPLPLPLPPSPRGKTGDQGIFLPNLFRHIKRNLSDSETKIGVLLNLDLNLLQNKNLKIIG
jgi:hypothetical protein